MEKQSSVESLLPVSAPSNVRPKSHYKAKLFLALFASIALLAPTQFANVTSAFSNIQNSFSDPRTTQLSCGQVEPLLPPKTVHDVSSVWGYKDRIIKWHQDAIRVPTQVYDEMGEPGVDPRWDVFALFHKHLEESYPLTHKALKKTTVDTWGLVYEWIGTDNSLQPLFLTGHQDVVPVLGDTIYQWEQPPFEGIYDGSYIWGRGSSDDKSTVTSIFASIELLLETSEFKPSRTVVIGLGHDEERGGMRGAPAIRDWMLQKYGPNSMAMLVDEGSGMANSWGRTFGLPAVAEKGKFDLNITVSTLGGHSSVPPPHTNIGLSALLIAQLEANPHPAILEKTSPVWGFLQCAADHAPDMPSSLKKTVIKSNHDAKAFKALPEELIEVGIGASWTGPGMGNMVRAMLSTTQATDIIYGGVKVNALPEVVTTIINHRLNIASSVSELKESIFETLLPTAKELDLAIVGFGYDYTPVDPIGTIFLRGCDFAEDLEPAPISPTSVTSGAWKMLAGTSRGLWASRQDISPNGDLVKLDESDELIMAPFMSTGNTDTRRYWDLTRNIFRWRYFPDHANMGAHTVNERVSADAMVEFVRFFQALILNVDASRDL